MLAALERLNALKIRQQVRGRYEVLSLRHRHFFTSMTKNPYVPCTEFHGTSEGGNSHDRYHKWACFALQMEKVNNEHFEDNPCYTCFERNDQRRKWKRVLGKRRRISGASCVNESQKSRALPEGEYRVVSK